MGWTISKSIPCRIAIAVYFFSLVAVSAMVFGESSAPLVDVPMWVLEAVEDEDDGGTTGTPISFQSRSEEYIRPLESTHDRGNTDLSIFEPPAEKRGWEQIDPRWRRPLKRAWEIIDGMWAQPHSGGLGAIEKSLQYDKRMPETFFSLPSKKAHPMEEEDDLFLTPTEDDRNNAPLISSELGSSNQQLQLFRRKLGRILESFEKVRSARDRLAGNDAPSAMDTSVPLVPVAGAVQPGNFQRTQTTGNQAAPPSKRGWEETGGAWQCSCCDRTMAKKCCSVCRFVLKYTNKSNRADFKRIKKLVCSCCKAALTKTETCCSICNSLN